MTNPSIAGIFATALGQLRRGSRRLGVQARALHPSTTPSRPTYTLDLQRDEVALGRFIKRLSVSGAENIQMKYPKDGVVRISMDCPMAKDAWETKINELVDRRRLHYAVA